MDGRIKMFNEEKGYGFILGVDSNDYFFHISHVKSVSNLSRGTYVHFTPSSGSKGLIALEIVPQEATQARPSFIAFGDVRINISNIKNYGIGKDVQLFVKVYEHSVSNESSTWNQIFHDRYVWNGLKQPVADIPMHYNRIKNRNGEIKTLGTVATDNDLIRQKVSYLYVTTYQGDNYRFNDWEVSFDIYEKCKELDSYML